MQLTCSRNRVHIGDIRLLTFTLTRNGTAFNLSGTGTTLSLSFHKPDNTIVTVTPTISDGANGIFTYLTTNLFDTTGLWKVQVYIDTTLVQMYSDIISLQVNPNLQ